VEEEEGGECKVIKVFSDIDQVNKSLTDPRFKIVDNPEVADVIWTQHYLTDFKYVTTNTYL